MLNDALFSLIDHSCQEIDRLRLLPLAIAHLVLCRLYCERKIPQKIRHWFRWIGALETLTNNRYKA
jgi:hypothetical protein